MILDEWRAYTVGSTVRQELKMEARAETLRYTEVFATWAKVLYQMSREAKGYDPSEMREFCIWNLEKCMSLDKFRDIGLMMDMLIADR